jgi:hypothetical protein
VSLCTPATREESVETWRLGLPSVEDFAPSMAAIASWALQYCSQVGADAGEILTVKVKIPKRLQRQGLDLVTGRYPDEDVELRKG